MSAVRVRWTARGDALDVQIAELLPTFATELRFVETSHAQFNSLVHCVR